MTVRRGRGPRIHRDVPSGFRRGSPAPDRVQPEVSSRCLHLQGWGEPLLHPGIVDFVRIAIRACLAVGTTTGGAGLDMPLAVAPVAAGPDRIAFSLPAPFPPDMPLGQPE